MSDTNAALIAFVGVLAGGYLNNFLAEDFRRFRDGQALAGALAGELKSHATAIPILQSTLQSTADAIRKPDTRITMQEFAPPTSPVFDSGVVKLGLLGPALAEEVAFVYEQIRAFRLGLQRISKHHPEMERETVAQVLEFCLTLITTAQERGTKLIADLQRYANEGYWRTRPWVWWTRNLG
ncbi:hypothetical protein AB4Y42_41950 [Paraburkholderia sp. EG286B]|uniref:hypothetical protein n=1 Tax=Paraburkholderia sp. EG286B TaxID=3237011 RepID=UPI0034D377E9